MARHTYDPALRTADIELLYDADDYFPDITQELAGATGVTLMIAGWAISPAIKLVGTTTLQQVIANVLHDPNGKCYILWNANMTGPAPGLFDTVQKFFTDTVKLAAHATAKDRLKIIISVNLDYDLGFRLTNYTGVANIKNWGRLNSDLTDTMLADLKDFWLKSFTGYKMPKGRKLGDYHNMTQFTLGSHHQKTLLMTGQKAAGKFLTGWCGQDLAGSVAGGSNTWHDACLRLRGDLALGLLDNFTDRWTFEMDRFADTVHFGVTATDTLTTSDVWAKVGGNPLEDAVETRRTMPNSITWINGGWTVYSAIARNFTTEVKSTYLDLIGHAEQFLFLENQYFRHPETAQAIRDRLDAEPNLQAVIVLPAYSEEIGQRADLPRLRQQYVTTTDATTRAKLLADAHTKGLSIDPFNKLTLWMQVNCLTTVMGNPRVRVWIPRMNPKNGSGRPYIHAKLCQVDDAKLFVGSANINGRSLDGFTDSEINVLLTDATEVRRIRARRRWHLVPDTEKDPRYGRWSDADPQPTYYAKTNLVRYTQDHLDVDRAFSAFPMGKAAMLAYWTAFTKSPSRRVGGWLGGVTSADVSNWWDKLDWFMDPETTDWGQFLSDRLDHLL